MRLPDKVRKTQFTREEQIYLAGRCETILPDAADQVFFKFGHQRNVSVPSLRSSSFSSQSSWPPLGVGCFSDSDTISESNSESNSDSGMDDPMMEGFRWMEDDDDLDLALDDYHTHIFSTIRASAKPSSRGPSFRRSFSLSNLPFGATGALPPNKSFKPPEMTQQPTPLSSKIPHISSQFVKPKPPPKPQSTPRPKPVIESSARYYQDPEARLKLRLYLASPQKFDEAIEFGFPSLQDDDVYIPPNQYRPPPPRKHHHAPPPPPGPLTWFHESNPSILDTLVSETDSDNMSTLSPPNSPAFRDPNQHRSLPRHAADPLLLDSGGSAPRKPYLTAKKTYPAITRPYYARVLPSTREMTLHMTLTRPDLRKDDDERAEGVYSDEDPLALAHLPSLGSNADIWDSLPARDGVVRKWWQKVSRTCGG